METILCLIFVFGVALIGVALIFDIILIVSGWQYVIVCNKCGYIHVYDSLAPDICPKCAGEFFRVSGGVRKDAHKVLARKKLIGWEFKEHYVDGR